jgi:hypothetical protein
MGFLLGPPRKLGSSQAKPETRGSAMAWRISQESVRGEKAKYNPTSPYRVGSKWWLDWQLRRRYSPTAPPTSAKLVVETRTQSQATGDMPTECFSCLYSG